MSLRIVGKGIVIQGEPGTDRQSCAFPQVAVLPTGRWLVSWRAAPTKGGNAGQHVLFSFSDDEGRTWSAPAAPFVPPMVSGSPGRFRALAFTALGGSRVLATLLWVDDSDPNLPYFNEQTEGLLDSRILLAESADGGRTWSPPTLMDTSPFNVPTPITGPVLRLPDGEWICQFETNKPYFDTAKWVHSSVMMFSCDGGRTWSRHSVVTRHPTVFYWDQRPQVLAEGRILDLFWTYDNAAACYLNIHARESRDAGRTWSEIWDTGVPGQPAPAVELPDGRLLMVYVDRTSAPAIRTRISRDGGRTWPADTQFSIHESELAAQTRTKAAMVDAWSEMAMFSVGLPAAAALPSGDVLVVYYAGPETDRTNVEWARYGLKEQMKTQGSDSWQALTGSQVERIRGAAWDHLERHGFVIQHEGLLASAKARGAQVDEVSGRIRLSRSLAAELMALVPWRYTVGNILGETWEIGGERQYGTAIVTDPWIIDYQTCEPRRPRLEDVRRHTIIAEQLEPVVSISRMDYPVTDEPGPTSSLRALETHLLHHTRHYQVMAASLESFEQWLGIADILARGGDVGRLISSGIAVGSPLVLNQLNGELLARSVRQGFTIIPTVCPMAGSTAPYSLAGTLLQSHLEVLMIALVTQMLRPGHAVEYVSGLSVTDLRNGADLYYTLDKVLWKNAAVQLGLAEHMPVGAECGGTLTHRYDPQAGAEGMLFMLAAHASGAHRIAGFGSCHNAVGMSAEMMVIQQAWLHAARHLTRGIRTDDLRLATASLERVGPGGQFLDDDLTVELMRSDEFFRDDVFDLSGGHGDSRPMLERAHDRVAELLAGYQSRVPEDIQEALRRHFSDLCGKIK